MKRLAKILFVLGFLFSVGGNLYLLPSLDRADGGGGQFKDSPDGKYTAQASSWIHTNRFRADYGETYGELSIVNVGDFNGVAPIIALRLTPAGRDYYPLARFISWSGDSKSVTFNLPQATCTLYVKSKQP